MVESIEHVIHLGCFNILKNSKTFSMNNMLNWFNHLQKSSFIRLSISTLLKIPFWSIIYFFTKYGSNPKIEHRVHDTFSNNSNRKMIESFIGSYSNSFFVDDRWNSIFFLFHHYKCWMYFISHRIRKTKFSKRNSWIIEKE